MPMDGLGGREKDSFNNPETIIWIWIVFWKTFMLCDQVEEKRMERTTV